MATVTKGCDCFYLLNSSIPRTIKKFIFTVQVTVIDIYHRLRQTTLPVPSENIFARSSFQEKMHFVTDSLKKKKGEFLG